MKKSLLLLLLLAGTAQAQYAEPAVWVPPEVSEHHCQGFG